MWTLGEDAIALSHADATSVFVALKPDESSFEEAIDGAGLATNEPAVACGAWWSGNVVASWTQITPRRARLCADGALLSEWRPDRDAGCVGAAVVSSSGRAAASLPARGVVVILRRVGDALIETARVRFDAEPSCLEIPPPRVADALVRAMRATESCDDAFEDEDECVLLSGTYARALEVTAIRETREDSVRSTSVFSPFFRASIALDDDAGAPASIRVSARDETRPAVLVTTRTGELVLMEPRREARGARLARPIAPPPATPKPPRLLSGDALRARLDADPGPRDIETILVDAEGISSRRGPRRWNSRSPTRPRETTSNRWRSNRRTTRSKASRTSSGKETRRRVPTPSPFLFASSAFVVCATNRSTSYLSATLFWREGDANRGSFATPSGRNASPSSAPTLRRCPPRARCPRTAKSCWRLFEGV